MITYTARQAMRHLSQIGFSDTPLFKQLTDIVIECDADLESDFTVVRSRELAVEVFRLSRNVGSVIQQVASK